LKTAKSILKGFLKAEIFRPEHEEDLPPTDKAGGEGPLKKSVQTPNIPGAVCQRRNTRSYYQIVREKIRRQHYRNYRHIQEEKIFLTFTLTRSGELKEAHVDTAKSVADEYLRRIALESVQESSPFPEFPIKLQDKEELAFNVIISFVLK
jgi:outer membrane biosynthesis protein TonB